MGQRWWSVIPTHVQYFTRASLATLLRAARLRAALGSARRRRRSASRYYLERVGGYSPRLARAAVAGARAAGLADRMWAPDFRDRMAVVAQVESPPL